MKRILPVVLVFIALASLPVACGGLAASPVPAASAPAEGAAEQTSAAAGPAKLFPEPVTFKIMFDSNVSYPTDPNCLVFKAIQDATNVKIDFNILPESNFFDKAKLLVASGNLPDILTAEGVDFTNQYGAAGAFIDVKKNLYRLPNFSKIYNDPANKEQMMSFTAVDGEMYGFPSMDYNGKNRNVWYYREDIFNKNKLALPDTYDGLYNVCKALKKLYPDSYPLNIVRICRTALKFNDLNIMGIQWGTGFPCAYDVSTGKWRLGLEDAGCRDLVAWLARMYAEKLIPPDFATMATDQYRQMVISDKSMISLFYLEDINLINSTFNSKNQASSIKFMPPPAGMTNGQHKMPDMGMDNELWLISTNSSKVEEALKYCDWFYTKEAENIASWGIEGQSYKVVNGEKQYIKPAGRENDNIRVFHGFETRGTFRLFDWKAKLSGIGPNSVEAFIEGAKYEVPFVPNAAFTAEEQNIEDNIGQMVINKAVEQAANLIMGKKPMSEWDAYVAEMKKIGADQIVKIRNDAMARAMSGTAGK